MAESEWIEKYFRPLVRCEGAVGLRDDVASLAANETLIVTTDTIVEGVHFLSSDPIDSVGHKIVIQNVSDILAKGALPTEAVLNLTWNSHRSDQELEEFAIGLGKMLRRCHVELIGGDTTVHDGGVVVSMTLHGRCISEQPIRRSNGNAADLVWVTGKIGSSGLGLQALNGNSVYKEFIQSYHYPAPPKRIIARAIADLATASMDVSDGLLLDAQRLAEASGQGVTIHLDKVPLACYSGSPELILQQCTSGDDYQILFTTPEISRSQVLRRAETQNWEVACIGSLQLQLGLRIFFEGREIEPPERLGFVHGSTERLYTYSPIAFNSDPWYKYRPTRSECELS